MRLFLVWLGVLWVAAGCGHQSITSVRNAGVGSAKTDNTDGQAIQGVWLPERAMGWNYSLLGEIRCSKLTISERSFALSQYRYLNTDVSGTFILDTSQAPRQIDLNSNLIDLTPTGSPVTYPPARLHGIYKLENQRLTICFQTGSVDQRPARFDASQEGSILLTFCRPQSGFADYPKDVSFTVLNPDATPAVGETVFQFMSYSPDRSKHSDAPHWRTFQPATTGPAGASVIPYSDFGSAGARDIQRGLIGFTTASPARLQNGSATIQLQPECLISGTLTCNELAKTGKPIGWTNVYLLKDGERIADCESTSGEYQFPVEPGDYALDAYGGELHSRYIPVRVPPQVREFHVDPIALTASRLALIKGSPALELSDIVGWKGKPTPISELRGQFVLLDFWGYWCNPCIEEMRVLMDLQEKYGKKGLAILTVHIDVQNEVDTAEKLDLKIADIRDSRWNKRDLPFPTALSFGKETPDHYNGISASEYGVLHYPTTILIDRAGNVVDEFFVDDLKSASEQIERLLGPQKPASTLPTR